MYSVSNQSGQCLEEGIMSLYKLKHLILFFLFFIYPRVLSMFIESSNTIRIYVFLVHIFLLLCLLTNWVVIWSERLYEGVLVLTVRYARLSGFYRLNPLITFIIIIHIIYLFYLKLKFMIA